MLMLVVVGLVYHIFFVHNMSHILMVILELLFLGEQ